MSIVVTTVADKREKSKADPTTADLSQADTFYLRVFTVAIRDVRFHSSDKKPAIELGIAPFSDRGQNLFVSEIWQRASVILTRWIVRRLSLTFCAL